MGADTAAGVGAGTEGEVRGREMMVASGSSVEKIVRHAAIDCGRSGARTAKPGVEAGKETRRKPGTGQSRDRLIAIVQHTIDGTRRRLSGDRMIERCGQSVDVRPRSLVCRAHLLRGGIAWREDRRRRRHMTGHRGARGPEVDQRRVALIVEHDVGRLDIAMQEARIVNLFEAIEHRPQYPAHGRRFQSSDRLQASVEGIAMDQFHDDISSVVQLEKVEDSNDPGRAMECRQGAAFGDEAFTPSGEIIDDPGRAWRYSRSMLANSQCGRQILLEGNFTAELGITCTVGNAKGALPQHGKHFVSSDLRARRQGHEIDVQERRSCRTWLRPCAQCTPKPRG